VEWGNRRLRALLRKLAAPGDVANDALAEALRRLTGAASAREALLVVADRALADYPAEYRAIVRRADLNGESAKIVARELHLSERTFYRYRAAAVTAIAAEIETITGAALPQQTEEIDLDALALYARGRYLWKRRTAESLDRAKHCFERAIRADADFARAHAGIADVHLVQSMQFLREPRAGLHAAHVAAERALSLDPTLAEAHATRGKLQLFERRDRRRARESLELALSIDPNDVNAHQFRALLALSDGDPDAAIGHVRSALSREPNSLDLQTTLGIALCERGMVERGARHLGEIVALDPAFVVARWQYVRALVRLKRFEEASEQLRLLIAVEPRSSYEAALAFVQALGGRPDAALHRLRSRPAGHPHYLDAWLHLGLGDAEAALRDVRAALRGNEPWTVMMRCDVFLSALHGDRRFAGLLAEAAEAIPLRRAS
jgi:tetratricopeptide (TPR) repeat protein